MSHILRLDKETAEQIRAGEVVERPASVVKELVENALDAGATEIRIHVRSGGRQEIAVRDNGVGLSSEDLELAILSHATSKLQRIGDLLDLHTYGFRGEALAAIAAVSRLTITSRERGAVAGHLLRVAGGEVLAREPAGAPPGTLIEVVDLFYNTPARREYLRIDATEQGKIADVTARLALARLDVAVELSTERGRLWATRAQEDLPSRIAHLYGSEIAADLTPLDYEETGIRITGQIGGKRSARRSRTGQILLVNGRPVFSAALRRVVEEAYSGYLLPGHFPFFVLHLLVPPAELDVNVHPTKAEVRFLRERALKALCFQAIRRTLVGEPARVEAAPAIPPLPVSYPPAKEIPPRMEQPLPAYPVSEPPGPSPSRPPLLSPAVSPRSASHPLVLPVPPEGPRFLGQAGALYLVFEMPDGLLLVDQHAAHERIHFERLLKREEPATVQLLLAPRSLEVGRMALLSLERTAEFLAALGFETEAFGETTVLLRGIPSGLSVEEGEKLLRDLLQELEAERESAPERLRRGRLALAACRAAIKAREPVREPEALALWRDLQAAEDPYHCPHGRSTMIRLSWSDLARGVERR